MEIGHFAQEQKMVQVHGAQQLVPGNIKKIQPAHLHQHLIQPPSNGHPAIAM